MPVLALHDFHQGRGAQFSRLNGCELVSGYSSKPAEYHALTSGVGFLDLSFRSRICLLGADREKFLHGQVTNDVNRLKPGQGCYAALVSGKGKIESDLFVHKLQQELLLDFEPGLTARVTDRLNKYIIAEDVQVVDVTPLYGLLAVVGPVAHELLAAFLPGICLPVTPLAGVVESREGGDFYLLNNPRFGVPAFDLFVPGEVLTQTAALLESVGKEFDARWAGFDAAEAVRIEHAIPRFGIDMTEATLPQEAEIQDRAVSFAKGCYIGQEIIARIRTYGQVAKALRLIRIEGLESGPLPRVGSKIFVNGKEAGFTCSSTFSPRYTATVALGYIRREVNSPGTAIEIEAEPVLRGTIIGSPATQGEIPA